MEQTQEMDGKNSLKDECQPLKIRNPYLNRRKRVETKRNK